MDVKVRRDEKRREERRRKKSMAREKDGKWTRG
jgi:hypothetical protein